MGGGVGASSLQLSQPLITNTKSGFAKFWNGQSDSRNFHNKASSELHLEQDQHMMDWPVFASGRVFTSSLLDVLPVHIFYNPSSPEILDKLIGARGDSELNHIIIESPVTSTKPMYAIQNGNDIIQHPRRYTKK